MCCFSLHTPPSLSDVGSHSNDLHLKWVKVQTTDTSRYCLAKSAFGKSHMYWLTFFHSLPMLSAVELYKKCIKGMQPFRVCWKDEKSLSFELEQEEDEKNIIIDCAQIFFCVRRNSNVSWVGSTISEKSLVCMVDGVFFSSTKRDMNRI